MKMTYIVLFLMFFPHSSISHADQIETTPIEDMIYFSEYILQGEIISTEVISIQRSETIETLYRHTTLRIDEVLKAGETPPDTIIINTLEGDLIQGETLLSLARLRATANMNVIVFISGIHDGYYRVHSGALGCFPIFNSRLMGTDTTIDEFKQQIRSFIAGDIDSITCAITPWQLLIEDWPVKVAENLEKEETVTVYPNPANPISNICYNLVAPSHVKLEVYAVSGHKVATLVNDYMPAGEYRSMFDGSTLASGTYLYRLVTDGIVNAGKILLVK